MTGKKSFGFLAGNALIAVERKNWNGTTRFQSTSGIWASTASGMWFLPVAIAMLGKATGITVNFCKAEKMKKHDLEKSENTCATKIIFR